MLQKLYPSSKLYIQQNVDKMCSVSRQEALQYISDLRTILCEETYFSVQSNEYLKDSCSISRFANESDILSSILDSYVIVEDLLEEDPLESNL
jgi:hypothetical protein